MNFVVSTEKAWTLKTKQELSKALNTIAPNFRVQLDAKSPAGILEVARVEDGEVEPLEDIMNLAEDVARRLNQLLIPEVGIIYTSHPEHETKTREIKPMNEYIVTSDSEFKSTTYVAPVSEAPQVEEEIPQFAELSQLQSAVA